MRLSPKADSKFLIYSGISFLVLFVVSLMVIKVKPSVLFRLALAGSVLLMVETAVELLLKKVLSKEKLAVERKLLASAFVVMGTVLLVFAVTSQLLLAPLALSEALVLVAISVSIAVAVTRFSKKIASRRIRESF